MKIVSLQLKNVSEPRKNLSSFFHQIKFIVLKRVQLQKSLLCYSATSFFPQIYIGWLILIGFAYSLIPVGFRALLILFLSFSSQKTYTGESLGPQVVLNRIYLRKCNISPSTSLIINLSFFKNAIKSELLGVRG